jgi:hypothetical protein
MPYIGVYNLQSKNIIEMSEHRFTLEPYRGPSTRHRCPACQTERKFARYIDNYTGQHIHTSVGRCDRENQCGWHYKPKQFFEDHPGLNPISPAPVVMEKPRRKIEPPRKITPVPLDMFKRTLNGYGANQFIQFLSKVFAKDVVNGIIERYFIGTSNKPWPGSVVFWQIDSANRVRAGKVMQYNPETGKRLKNPDRDFITWIHKVEAIPDFELNQCFFGEHLLKDSTKPVAIVESEKTAMIASVHFPEFVWLACGQLNGLNPTKGKVLKGRKVVLFPDVNGYEKWKTKANELSTITTITVSDFLERLASPNDRADGCDLADFLLRMKVKPPVESKPERKEITAPHPTPIGKDGLLERFKPFYSVVEDRFCSPGSRKPLSQPIGIDIARNVISPDESCLKKTIESRLMERVGLWYKFKGIGFDVLLDSNAIFNVPKTPFFKLNSIETI